MQDSPLPPPVGLGYCTLVIAAMLTGGGRFCERQHVLSRDGRLLFACCQDAVLAFSTSSGDLLFKLQHPDVVTAAALDPLHDSRLYTACSDGSVGLWDLSTGSAVQWWSAGFPVESMVVGDNGEGARSSLGGRRPERLPRAHTHPPAHTRPPLPPHQLPRSCSTVLELPLAAAAGRPPVHLRLGQGSCSQWARQSVGSGAAGGEQSKWEPKALPLRCDRCTVAVQLA